VCSSDLVEPAHLTGWWAFAFMLMVGVPLALVAAYGFFLVFERPFLTIRSSRDLQAAIKGALRRVGSRQLPRRARSSDVTQL